MTEPIDLVYAWCDDADPKWRAKRETTAARFGVTFDAVHNGACRYRGGDMLRYSLRSAFRFAPWVRNVFVVMDDDQSVPDWPELKENRIKVVRHSEIMPREILSCFSSGVIEHHIARIPGLADRYLYANDDTLFWEETPPSFFFARDGYPYFRFGAHRKPSANDVEQDYRCRLGAVDALLRARFGMKAGPRSMIGRLPHHNVDAYCRADMLACYECFREAIEAELAFPFRNPKLIQRAVYAGYAIAVGHGHFRRATFNTNYTSAWWRRLLPRWADSLQVVPGRWREAPELFARFRPKLVCFNDGPDTTDEDFVWLRAWLEKSFPVA
jgi:hypothetical protein